MKTPQLHFAIEAIRQSLNDASPQYRFSAPIVNRTANARPASVMKATTPIISTAASERRSPDFAWEHLARYPLSIRLGIRIVVYTCFLQIWARPQQTYLSQCVFMRRHRGKKHSYSVCAPHGHGTDTQKCRHFGSDCCYL